MMGLSAGIGVLGAVSGYFVARALDSNIGGAMVTMLGVIFGLVFLLSPERGLVALFLRQREQKWAFAKTALTIHLLQHEGTPEAEEETRVDHLQKHLRWESDFASQVVVRAQRQGLIARQNGHMVLTNEGRERATTAMTAF
jgi:manganese/zinc/iron transport system permease protein